MEYIGDKDDLTYVCEDCGSDEILEKVWVSVNDTIIKDKKPYSAFSSLVTQFKLGLRSPKVKDYCWCDKCCMEASVITMREYKERSKYAK